MGVAGVRVPYSWVGLASNSWVWAWIFLDYRSMGTCTILGLNCFVVVGTWPLLGLGCSLDLAFRAYGLNLWLFVWGTFGCWFGFTLGTLPDGLSLLWALGLRYWFLGALGLVWGCFFLLLEYETLFGIFSLGMCNRDIGDFVFIRS